jgi:hypothetical protein
MINDFFYQIIAFFSLNFIELWVTFSYLIMKLFYFILDLILNFLIIFTFQWKTLIHIKTKIIPKLDKDINRNPGNHQKNNFNDFILLCFII